MRLPQYDKANATEIAGAFSMAGGRRVRYSRARCKDVPAPRACWTASSPQRPPAPLATNRRAKTRREKFSSGPSQQTRRMRTRGRRGRLFSCAAGTSTPGRRSCSAVYACAPRMARCGRAGCAARGEGKLRAGVDYLRARCKKLTRQTMCKNRSLSG